MAWWESAIAREVFSRDDLTAEHCGDACVGEILQRARERIAVDDCEIGVIAGFEGTDSFPT
jgi:hypothetical protein